MDHRPDHDRRPVGCPTPRSPTKEYAVCGSLAARNDKLVLDRYPRLLIARGAGEPTSVDTIAYFHDDLPLADVRGIGYTGTTRGVGMAMGRSSLTAAAESGRQS
jgi:hypothetical protein